MDRSAAPVPLDLCVHVLNRLLGPAAKARQLPLGAIWHPVGTGLVPKRARPPSCRGQGGFPRFCGCCRTVPDGQRGSMSPSLGPGMQLQCPLVRTCHADRPAGVKAQVGGNRSFASSPIPFLPGFADASTGCLMPWLELPRPCPSCQPASLRRRKPTLFAPMP